MYEVVGCGSCRALWIREGQAETATCPRCGTRHQVDRLRTLAETEHVEAAREARSALLAARDEHGDDVAGYLELLDDVEAAGVAEEAYLEAHGVDVGAAGGQGAGMSRQRDRREIVRSAVRKCDLGTEERIIAQASEHGLDPPETRRVLEKLVTNGMAVRDGQRYRLI